MLDRDDLYLYGRVKSAKDLMPRGGYNILHLPVVMTVQEAEHWSGLNLSLFV